MRAGRPVEWEGLGDDWLQLPLWSAVSTAHHPVEASLGAAGDPRGARACDQVLEARVAGRCCCAIDYASAGKPVCDYEDPQARKALIDASATDAHAILGVVDGKELSAAVGQAALVLAAVVGQDLDGDAGGRFRLAKRVAKDRLISTVDPDARHGRKTRAQGLTAIRGMSRWTPTAS